MVMGLCKLCLQDRPLVEGHVLSEFLYDDVYDQNRHKFLQLHTDLTKRNIRRSKGLYEPMMCDHCDNRIISGYETYVSRVLNGGVEIVIQHKPDRIVVSELDYAKFKLFQVSLLWRCAISTLGVSILRRRTSGQAGERVAGLERDERASNRRSHH